MCSKPAVNTVARVVSGVTTLGASEIARNNLSSSNFLNQALNTPGNIATAGQGGNGLISAGLDAAGKAILPKVPAPPPPAPPEEGTSGDQPRPGGPAPGTTSVESLQARRRKRLAALQSGLASTIVTGPGGAAGSPSLLSPSAGGLKLKLGA